MKTITTYEELIQDLINNKITMVNPNEFNMVIKHYNNINKIQGDIVECGVWRGGFSIFLSHLFKVNFIFFSIQLTLYLKKCNSFGDITDFHI